MLTNEIKASIDECVLCWLATVDDKGQPSCSPKEVFAARGDSHLVIANIASPGSVANIQHNPQVCVSLIHVLKQKGFQLKGHASYISAQEDDFSTWFAAIEPLVGKSFPVAGVFSVAVEQAKPIIAPSYLLVPGTTEASQIASAKKSYGV
jgi:predicted pyridoxine 5'-phosphate oxidase superfamily flavin-nucleotide-binding protein